MYIPFLCASQKINVSTDPSEGNKTLLVCQNWINRRVLSFYEQVRDLKVVLEPFWANRNKVFPLISAMLPQLVTSLSLGPSLTQIGISSGTHYHKWNPDFILTAITRHPVPTLNIQVGSLLNTMGLVFPTGKRDQVLAYYMLSPA